jgi:diadenosine tetraphosphate (Ap4A) HIT family hydrolase
MNVTMTKFGYPESLVGESEHWVVVVRPKQITAGSLVLIARSEARALPDLSLAEVSELPRVTALIESSLQEVVGFSKINYLALMMVDPHVHFHVIPRYSGVRSVGGTVLPDVAWPGPPDLSSGREVESADMSEVVVALRAAWTRAVSSHEDSPSA